MDAGNGNILAFFELPNSPQMGKDPNTPEWVQHIALRVKDEDALMEAKKKSKRMVLKYLARQTTRSSSRFISLTRTVIA